MATVLKSGRSIEQMWPTQGRGVAYHGLHFAKNQQSCVNLAVLFVAQGVQLAYAGVVRSQLPLGINSAFAGSAGIVIVAYAIGD